MTTTPGAEAVGQIVGPFPMLVEGGKIREFLRATGGSPPPLDDEPRPVIPPTFLQTTRFWEPPGTPNVLTLANLDLRRVLQGSQEYEFNGPPPRAGDRLTFETSIVDVVEKVGSRGGPMRIFTIETRFRDETGRVVAVGRAMTIETSKPPTTDDNAERSS